VFIDIDPASGMPATPLCPRTQAEAYVAGTQPVGTCPLHGGGRPITSVTGWETQPGESTAQSVSGDSGLRVSGSGNDGQVRTAAPPSRMSKQDRGEANGAARAQTAEQPKKEEEKKGFFRRLMNVFK
jgi:hypothetical protein